MLNQLCAPQREGELQASGAAGRCKAVSGPSGHSLVSGLVTTLLVSPQQNVGTEPNDLEVPSSPAFLLVSSSLPGLHL